ncbi:hypothetical protein EXU57_24010 [Segetibacter sp. 3557_3]|uniref:YecA family protein n=1 Tax=Segetibacter sp. 3557_3 TaxID=2547429 RepID=UPI0010589B42|nr:SEC-C domain-containing protein [Segetibacter sp. 3557_3]TDH18272.1 hypothetical protein EXU57_24010 [Segetibacter sp. 3557_3]
MEELSRYLLFYKVNLATAHQFNLLSIFLGNTSYKIENVDKTGRNAPCPCGSGKKYKRCHGHGGTSSLPRASQLNYRDLISRFNPLPAIKLLGALQLVIDNHGKNVLFEEMARIGLLEQRKNDGNRENAYWEDLKPAIETYTDRIYRRDEPTNAFTENVVFAEGNYLVYPGTHVSGSLILNEVLDCIFLVRNEYPELFKNQVNDAVGLLLHLSESSAHLSHQRNLFERSTTSTIVLPDFDTAMSYYAAITFPKKYVEEVCKRRNYDAVIINEFLIDINDPLLDNDDPDQNRTVKRPILWDGKDFVLYMPTGVVPALIDFIYEKARQYNCLKSLRQLLQQRQFEKACLALKHMGWFEIVLKLPENSLNLSIKEAIFRFDNDKLGYLCFIGKHFEGTANEQLSPDSFQKRNEEIIKTLSNIFPEHPARILSVFALGEFSDDLIFMLPNSPDNHQSIALSFTELETIAFSEKANILTLWKFAKTLKHTSKTFQIESQGGTLDAYVAYQENQGSFYDPNNENPIGGSLFIPVGFSNDFRREMQKERDEHATPIFYNRQLGYIKVIRYKKYAPIYREKEPIATDEGEVFRLAIETYKMPIWIINRYSQEKGSSYFAKLICEGIAFWLQKMEIDLKPALETLSFVQYEVEAIVDERLQDLIQYEEAQANEQDVRLGITIEPPAIQIHIPYEFISLVRRTDNYADKLLMRTVLSGIMNYIKEAKDRVLLTEHDIEAMVEKNLQPENAKMFLFNDASWRVKLDTRGLLPLYFISETDTSYILDHLASYLPKEYVIPKVIERKDKKRELCNKIVAALIEQITNKLQPFNGEELLAWLIRLNEKAINIREFDNILVPARIACFSSVEKEMEELHEKEQQRVATAQALRTLIEFVAANPPKGTHPPSFDDIGEMLALVEELIAWGSISDSIWKNLDDPQMGLLPSGRIGVGKKLQTEVLQPFALSKTAVEVHQYIKAWNTNYQKPLNEKTDKDHLLLSDEFDKAFEKEFDIKLSRLTTFIQILAAATQDTNESQNSSLSCL